MIDYDIIQPNTTRTVALPYHSYSLHSLTSSEYILPSDGRKEIGLQKQYFFFWIKIYPNPLTQESEISKVEKKDQNH